MLAVALAVVVVEELEHTLPQLQHCESAGAPTLRVPRSSNAGNTRAALTVAQAITWSSGMPNIRNFDITFEKSTTPGLLRDIAFQSVERVSGQKPCLVARSTISQLK